MGGCLCVSLIIRSSYFSNAMFKILLYSDKNKITQAVFIVIIYSKSHQESGNVYLSQNTQITLYKIIQEFLKRLTFSLFRNSFIILLAR